MSGNPISPDELAHHQTASSLDYKDWDTNDVQTWLEEHLKMPQYKEVFSRLCIDGSLMDHINDADLQNDFGIQVRLHRVKIIEGIKKLQQQASQITQAQQIQYQQQQLLNSIQNVSIQQQQQQQPHQQISPIQMQQQQIQNPSQQIYMNNQQQQQYMLPHQQQRPSNLNQFNPNQAQNMFGNNNNNASNFQVPQQNPFQMQIPSQLNQQMNVHMNQFSNIQSNNQMMGVQQQQNVNMSGPINQNSQIPLSNIPSQLPNHQSSRVDTPPHNNQRVDNQMQYNYQNQRQMIGGAQQNSPSHEILVLKAVEGQLLNNVYIVGENGASLGRHSASNDIVISESFVSRRHCEIKYSPDDSNTNNLDPNVSKFYIRDIGSTTGSFIMVRQEVLLKQNMMFQMGLSEYKVVLTSKKCMIELHVFEGPARNKIIPVDELGLGIGRDQNNSFCVQDDSQMSNFHAKIIYYKASDGKQEGFYLQDVGSTNRTWLRLSSEGEQSNLHPLKINDILKIGSTVFVVQTNDMQNFKNMPVINKRLAVNNLYQNLQSEEEKNNNQMIVDRGNGIAQLDILNQQNESNQIQQIPQSLFGGNQAADRQMNGNNNNQNAAYSQDICKICYEQEGDAAFIPCGHNFACVKCASRCECCPVCRMQFDDIIKIYKH